MPEDEIFNEASNTRVVYHPAHSMPQLRLRRGIAMITIKDETDDTGICSRCGLLTPLVWISRELDPHSVYRVLCEHCYGYDLPGGKTK